MARLRSRLARAGVVTAMTGLTATGLATTAAADPANNPADVQTLMSHLSGGYTPADCHPAGAHSAVAVAAVNCDNYSHDPGGPWNADYLLYANTDDLNADFQRSLTEAPQTLAQPFPDGTKGPTEWNRGGHNGSVVFLGTGRDDGVYLVWTDIPARTLVVAEQGIAPESTQAALYDWWQAEGVR
ncbi:hypothetical protein A5624_01830 [Mycobacterium sp. 1482292.6]|uniref:hypothetical protein n=1 Tax=unclassified Mycobacterium TaxID=2642494 RepID=UPI0008019582|nr:MULTISPECIES: hypothetical protein [unclassified Mycobacterium]OBJ04163.1 hypothetical protein A5624_01830 [Mycobacterium sp. 1482292.6]OBK08269.1 hypothetical protein A9W96_13255 [Mycobacterium sp. 1245852.3]